MQEKLPRELNRLCWFSALNSLPYSKSSCAQGETQQFKSYLAYYPQANFDKGNDRDTASLN